MPRKSMLDEGKRREVIAIISVGCTRYAAARYIGCRPWDIAREIGRNKDFALQVARAEEAAEVFYLQQIKAAAKKEQYWRAAAWVLERRNPNRYAARGAQTITFEQIAKWITQIAEIIGGEINDPEVRANILKRLRTLTIALFDGEKSKEPEIIPEENTHDLQP